ncbi:MAG: hypothetical protein ABI673_09290 [Novosphingobium sp.]
MIRLICQRAGLPVIALALAALGGCSTPDNASGPGGVTVGEARALDDAAQMIEKQQLPPGAIPSAPVPAPR